MTLGQAIKTKRQENGLSVIELSESMFATEDTIRKYERNAVDISFSRIEDICKILKISLAELMKEVDICQR